ncbi:type II toxin-antitoxin system VapC family toxin [Candidatus Collierbacteria bacterium]|nr:type II toxin-antitoxin system VapC family toxin [Candidatus Collierbacteria bacterium]
MIFIDADAFIGISVPLDAHHQHASGRFEQLKERGEKLATSWDVVGEVATKLSRFTTKKTALQFLKFLEQSSIQIFFIDEKLADEVLTLFSKQSSKRVSLTDCANMAIARKLGVEVFLSFDEHYLQNGFGLFDS